MLSAKRGHVRSRGFEERKGGGEAEEEGDLESIAGFRNQCVEGFQFGDNYP